jgi:tRNA A37 methylthiotransferase MiaB
LLENSNDIFNNDDKLFPRTNGKLDFVLRIEDLKYLPHILTHIFDESIGQEHKFDDYLKAKQLRENPASATIIIQTGCDNYCSFCIVPYTR